MTYQQQSQTTEERGHACPQDCVRLVGETYVDCEECALMEEQEQELGLCPREKHMFQALAHEIDGRPLERCMRCGCWRW